MFSTFEKLKERTGRNKPDRFEFLKKLVEEFSAPNSTKDVKHQVIANLANFAYDPINYEYLRKLSVLNIFLDLLAEDDLLLIRFAISGLCNLCLDRENKEYILASGGVQAISKLLLFDDEETVLSSITSLMFLITPESKTDITDAEIIKSMLKCSTNRNNRIANLATIFLEDYCTREQVDLVKSNFVGFIPLPEYHNANVTFNC